MYEKYKYLLAAKDLLKAAKRSACHEDAPYNSFEALFNITDQDGYNVLQLAVQQNNANAVWLILHQDPAYQNGRSSKNKELKSLIYMAAGKRYNDTVKGLCIIYEAGNTVDYEEQTLLQAAIIGHDRASVVGVLEDHVHLVVYDDHRGWTPLHYAAYHGFDSILDLLVITKESVECHIVYRENVPTPLHIAAKEGHDSTVVKLMQILPQSSCDINDYGENVLHILARERNKKLIQSVLKYIPAEALNQKNISGNTPLHILVRESCYVPEFIRHRKVEKMALNKGGSTPFDMLYRKEEITGDQVQFKMALDNAREKHEYLFIAKDLLKAAKRSACHEDAPYNSFEALFNITDEDGYNVLQLAVHQNNRDAVELILKEDLAYQQQRSNKNSELKSLASIAAEKGYKDIVKLVCETYEARNEIGRVGQTTLHAAIIYRA
ncbi:hypothetical protein ACET3Z_009184 [Daucus carota]